jgi:hypothetical protein
MVQVDRVDECHSTTELSGRYNTVNGIGYAHRFDGSFYVVHADDVSPMQNSGGDGSHSSMESI